MIYDLGLLALGGVIGANITAFGLLAETLRTARRGAK